MSCLFVPENEQDNSTPPVCLPFKKTTRSYFYRRASREHENMRPQQKSSFLHYLRTLFVLLYVEVTLRQVHPATTK